MNESNSFSIDSVSPDETLAIGRRLAPLLTDGDVVLLNGRLGAGKTLFVGGIAEALSGGEFDVLPFDDIQSLPDLARHLGTSALPFAIQGRLEGEQNLTSIMGLLGARTSPETLSRSTVVPGKEAPPNTT